MGQPQTKTTLYCYGGCYIEDCTLLNDVSIVAKENREHWDDYDCHLYSCLTGYRGCVCAQPDAYFWKGTTHCHYLLDSEKNSNASSTSNNKCSVRERIAFPNRAASINSSTINFEKNQFGISKRKERDTNDNKGYECESEEDE